MTIIDPPIESYTARLKERSVAIFLFHGVVHQHEHLVRNYIRKHIDQSRFVAILRALKAKGHALSMEDVLAHSDEGTPFPDNSFAITFDDGFENNHSVAAPVLIDLKLPATFYVCTRFVDENRMGWIDRIEHCIENTAAADLVFPWLSEPLSFSNTEQKITTLKVIREKLKGDSNIDPDTVSAEVARQCGRAETFSSADPLDQKMSWHQVAELHRQSEFIIGGHSQNHRILAHLNDEELRTDIDTSIQLLKEKAGVNSHHYAYPEGQADHYDERTIAILKSHGIRCSPSAIDGVDTIATDPFHLHRIFAK